MIHRIAAVFFVSVLSALAIGGEPAPVSHPYMLWTKEEAAALKKKIETDPWAKAAYENLLKESGRGGTFRNLFRYVVMGDVKAGEAEKKYLLGFIGTHPRNFEGIDHGGRHYSCYLDALRYDSVYDLLTPDERTKIEDTFRAYIKYQLEDTKVYTRTSWLPNMQWPRPMAAHIMAVVLNDRELIRALVNSNGGWKWYLDSYMTSEGFYMEEFGKHYSMIGEMLLFCRGLRRIGLDEIGYGYTGAGGATMRKYVESILKAGYPRTEIPGGMPCYGKITMGDARGPYLKEVPPYIFEHSIVAGSLPGRADVMERWTGMNMNGRDHKNAKIDKMVHSQWYEIAHALWPDAGFDYILAQMRKPGDAVYTPTLYWGLDPIDPAKVKAPPAPSYVSRERGLAFLRADESPAYWESPAPAVSLGLAMYYVHYTHDPFALYGFVAFNRPLYHNRNIGDGYSGGDPFVDSARGHAGLVVDNQKGSHVGQLPTRSLFDAHHKFVAVSDDPRISGGKIRDADDKPIDHKSTIFPDATQTRAMVLTREYLFDVIRAESPKPRTYHWQVHAIGQGVLDGDWQTTTEWDGGKLYVAPGTPVDAATATKAVAKAIGDPARYDLNNVRRRTVEGPWSVKILQGCALPDVSKSLLGKAWYDRKIGVRVGLLPEPRTTVFVGDTPRRVKEVKIPDEVGGTTLIVQRVEPSTTFVALHEPIENDAARIETFTRVAQTESAVAARIATPGEKGFDDRVLVRFDHQPAEPVTLTGGDESYTFAGHAYLRITPQRVEASGDLRALRLPVTGTPELHLNGAKQAAKVEGGVLVFKKD